jgi:hypothetical protein
MAGEDLTQEQREKLRVSETNSYDANALPQKYKPPIPPSGVQLLPTKAVRFRATGHEGVVNAVDFNPDVHEELGGKGDGRAALEKLTVAQLKELAAARDVELEEGAKKADIVAALEAAGVSVE